MIRAYFSPARGLVPFALLAALVGIAVLRHRDSEVQDAAARQQLDSARQYLFAHRDELKSRDDCQWVPDFVRAGCLATLPAASPEQARENGRYWAQDQRHRVENARDCTQGPNRRAEFVAGCEEEVARRRQAAQ